MLERYLLYTFYPGMLQLCGAYCLVSAIVSVLVSVRYSVGNQEEKDYYRKFMLLSLGFLVLTSAVLVLSPPPRELQLLFVER